MDSFKFFFAQRFWRHLKHPAIWVVIILTMIAARFFIPLPEDAYVTLSINEAFPVPSSSVIGLQLGIIAALLLSPLAYIYLKAGPTRIHPWQVEDVTASRRFALNLGQGLGDIAALFFVLFWIGVAGLILCFFRLPFSEINPFHLFMTLFLVAGPAMAMTAGVKHILGARPWLRGAWGDVLFFIFWMAGNVVAAMLFEFETLNLGYDIFGFAASAAVSTSEPVTAMVVGGAPSSDQFIQLDPVKGFGRPDFLFARAQWFCVAIILLVLSALIYGPRRLKFKKRNSRRGTLMSGLDTVGQRLAGLFPFLFKPMPVLYSSATQILKPGWLVLFLLGLSVAGFFLPFRKIIGPAIFLLLIFMTSRFGSSWEARHLRQLRSVMPTDISRQAIMSGLAMAIITALLCMPAIIAHVLKGEVTPMIYDVMIMAAALPVVTIGLGMLTRSATFARLLLLGAWYAYLNI